MRKRLLFLFISLSVFLLCFTFLHNANAQTISTSTSQINAEILSNIWYSTTTVNEGDKINIYAGFQNHSDENLTGTAGFYVDDTQISKTIFSANSKSLIKLESQYLAVRGEHTVYVKILDIAEMNGNLASKLQIENLLASETEKNKLSVKYQITASEIINNAQTVTNSVINTIDTYAQKTADYVESLKQPTSNTATTNTNPTTDSQISQKLTGKVLGISTENPDAKSKVQKTTPSWKTYIYNFFLDILAFTLRHWIWTAIVVILLILYLTLR